MSSKCCVDKDFLEHFLNQLYDLLVEAYYTTPPYIASRSLIKRSKDIVHLLRVSIENVCLE